MFGVRKDSPPPAGCVDASAPARGCRWPPGGGGGLTASGQGAHLPPGLTSQHRLAELGAGSSQIHVCGFEQAMQFPWMRG